MRTFTASAKLAFPKRRERFWTNPQMAKQETGADVKGAMPRQSRIQGVCSGLQRPPCLAPAKSGGVCYPSLLPAGPTETSMGPLNILYNASTPSHPYLQPSRTPPYQHHISPHRHPFPTPPTHRHHAHRPSVILPMAGMPQFGKTRPLPTTRRQHPSTRQRPPLPHTHRHADFWGANVCFRVLKSHPSF